MLLTGDNGAGASLPSWPIWANRQLLNADNWAQTSTSLLQNTAIRTATANYLVDQLYNERRCGGQGQIRPAATTGRPWPARRRGAAKRRGPGDQSSALPAPWSRTPGERQPGGRTQASSTCQRRQPAGVGQQRQGHAQPQHILNDVASSLGISADIGAKLPPSVANLMILKANQMKAGPGHRPGAERARARPQHLVPLLYVLAMLVALPDDAGEPSCGSASRGRGGPGGDPVR